MDGKSACNLTKELEGRMVGKNGDFVDRMVEIKKINFLRV